MDKLISLQDAIKAIDEKAKRIKCEDTLNGLAGAIAILFDLPSVKPQEPKTGHWLMTGESDVYYDLPSYECSKCGQTSLEEGDYCPNCGARMVEEQESEEV